jgi:hypothetical protein
MVNMEENKIKAWLARSVLGLGDITLEHAKAGPEHGKIADNISDRPVEYKQYVSSLLGVLKQKFEDKIQGEVNTEIFDYVQRNGGSKEANVYLFQSYIDLKSGVKSFSSENKAYHEKFIGYLNKMGIKYKSSTVITPEVSVTGLGMTGIKNKTNYTISIE